MCLPKHSHGHTTLKKKFKRKESIKTHVFMYACVCMYKYNEPELSDSSNIFICVHKRSYEETRMVLGWSQTHPDTFFIFKIFHRLRAPIWRFYFNLFHRSWLEVWWLLWNSGNPLLMSFEDDFGLGINGGREEESLRVLEFRFKEDDDVEATIPDANNVGRLLTTWQIHFCKIKRALWIETFGPFLD